MDAPENDHGDTRPVRVIRAALVKQLKTSKTKTKADVLNEKFPDIGAAQP